ncbi:MAG TPA: secondary thiamine-phosphate synthase enzyme YjbQ [Acidimicrobiia bacterium]|nr:secondary thiamine-phosphate synthase enzyme YjbQ [Acidimicrobiia bacterium]
MHTHEISLDTGRRKTTVDITSEATSFCQDKGDGLLSVFAPHATAGIAMFETGAGSETDVLDAVDRLLPADPSRWRHEHGTPGHGRDHVLPAFISPSITIPVLDGKPALGTWQSIVLVDTNVDNPSRRVRLSFIPG